MKWKVGRDGQPCGGDASWPATIVGKTIIFPSWYRKSTLMRAGDFIVAVRRFQAAQKKNGVAFSTQTSHTDDANIKISYQRISLNPVGLLLYVIVQQQKRAALSRRADVRLFTLISYSTRLRALGNTVPPATGLQNQN